MIKVDLKYNGNIILKDIRVAKSVFQLAKGLRFASFSTVKKGLCLQFPKESRRGAATDMLFCFYKYEVIFINSHHIIVDKVVLQPWRVYYVPKKKCNYSIESVVGTFKQLNIGDKVELVF